jgi:predicted ribosome quality control (RQC) complex YloA/Tae2 family protein
MKKISILEAEAEVLEQIIDDKISKYIKETIKSNINSFEEMDNIAKEDRKKLRLIYAEISLLKQPKYQEIPNYGDHMTMENFIKNVNSGGFIDYDGSGNYATATQMTDITIQPSYVKSGKMRKDFTHIVWFNR